MPSSYLWFKDRKTANKGTMFLIVVVIISLVIGLFINKKQDVKQPKIEKTKKLRRGLLLLERLYKKKKAS